MTTNTYTADVNGQVFAGRFNRPLWRRSMLNDTWAVVPSTNILADINPRNDPLINPNFPNKAEWEALGSFSAIITAWCGAVWDEDNLDYHIPFIAGHADYAGGETYGIKLSEDNPAFRMVRKPSGALPDAIITNDGQENSGLYADGRPRAVHTYNKILWVNGYGVVLCPQGNTSHLANGGTLRTIIQNPVNGEMTRFGSSLDVGSPGDYSGGGTAWDESRRCIWVRRVGTGRFHRYFIDTDTWQADVSDSLATSGNVGMVYVPDHDCIVWFCTTFDNANEIGVLNCSTGAITRKVVSGTLIGCRMRGTCQPILLPDNRIAFWSNSTDTQLINVLSFDSHPISGSWSVNQLPVNESNDILPTAAVVNGTYGRFFYSKRLGGFGVINSINQQMYFFGCEL
jgi:hypothetical protein